MIGGIGLPELIIVLVIALLVFGASRLPEVGKSLGRAIREFKEGFESKPESRPEEPQQAKEEKEAKED